MYYEFLLYLKCVIKSFVIAVLLSLYDALTYETFFNLYGFMIFLHMKHFQICMVL